MNFSHKVPTFLENCDHSNQTNKPVLFRNLQEEPHLSFWDDNRGWKTLSLDSPKLRDYILVRSMQWNNKCPSEKEINELIRRMRAQALLDNRKEPVFTRLGWKGNCHYLDMANDKGEMIEITAQGWRVTTEPHVWFVRSKDMAPFPTPKSGGSIELLRKYVNFGKDNMNFVLLVGGLLALHYPKHSQLVMSFSGEHGSAKSTLCKMICSLVDPSSSPVKKLPGSERDFAILAKSTRLLVFDNISSMTNRQSDMICRAVTGSSFTTQKLRTDTEQINLQYTSPILLNGIPDLMGNPDLLDRSLIFHLPPIPPNQIKDEDDFWAEFEQDRPYILGALLDAMVSGLAYHKDVNLTHSTRIKHLIKFVTAAEPALGWPQGTFLKALLQNKTNLLTGDALDNVLGLAVHHLMHSHDEWIGTPNELLQELMSDSPMLAKYPEFPKSPQQLSPHLKRLIPGLRLLGIHICPPTAPQYIKQGGITARLYRIHKESASQAA